MRLYCMSAGFVSLFQGLDLLCSLTRCGASQLSPFCLPWVDLFQAISPTPTTAFDGKTVQRHAIKSTARK